MSVVGRGGAVAHDAHRPSNQRTDQVNELTIESERASERVSVRERGDVNAKGGSIIPNDTVSKYAGMVWVF